MIRWFNLVPAVQADVCVYRLYANKSSGYDVRVSYDEILEVPLFSRRDRELRWGPNKYKQHAKLADDAGPQCNSLV